MAVVCLRLVDSIPSFEERSVVSNDWLIWKGRKSIDFLREVYFPARLPDLVDVFHLREPERLCA